MNVQEEQKMTSNDRDARSTQPEQPHPAADPPSDPSTSAFVVLVRRCDSPPIVFRYCVTADEAEALAKEVRKVGYWAVAQRSDAPRELRVKLRRKSATATPYSDRYGRASRLNRVDL
jgi:hypothetical protein